jgi:hypothetical protein
MKQLLVHITLMFFSLAAFSQSEIDKQTIIKRYKAALDELTQLATSTEPLSFKKAVFTVENTYWDNELDYELFNQQIENYTKFCKAIINSRDLLYNEDDKEQVKVHAAIFWALTDTIPIQFGNEIVKHEPFTYDFEDFFGHKDWSKMFVVKLLNTKSGNCHSMPYLYKILAEELGEEAYLSLAPNHIYIKLKNKNSGWYNTELTSGIFPIDAWLKSSGYIHMNAIRNGIFMDTLGQQQSIALCMIDLAQGYEKKLGINDGKFILKACDIALKYYPNYINALIIKAETQRKLIAQQAKIAGVESISELFIYSSATQELFNDMEQTYSKIHQLGYRKMPEQMYIDWLVSLEKNKEQYQNKKIINFNSQ